MIGLLIDGLTGLQPPFTLTAARLWPGPDGGSGVVHVTADGTVGAVGPGAVTAAHEMPGPTVDLEGRWVAPGFVDPHVHVRAVASARASVDVSEARNAEEVLRLVEDAAGSVEPDAWVSLWGLQPEELARGLAPRSEDLDRAAGGRPVRIRHRSTHAWLFSTRALDHLSLRSGRPPETVTLEVDASGRPTGAVIDHGGWVGERMGRITPATRIDDEVRAWSRQLAREGVVAIVDATARNGRAELEQLRDWSSDGVIVQRLAAMAAPSETRSPDGLRFAGHKLMSPFDPDELRTTILASWDAGIDVAVHCLEAAELGALIEAVEPISPPARGTLRIEHASVCPPEWLPRIRRLGATVVTHPGFVHAHGDRYLRHAELQPHEWLYRHASWIRAGVPLAFASDAPAGPTDPLQWLRSACSRRTRSGAVLGADEAIDVDEALWCATVGAARAAGIRGPTDHPIHPGAMADLVVLRPGSGGLLDDATTVEATMLGGRIVAG